MTTSVDSTLEAIVRRDRVIVVTALAVVAVLSWAYLLAGAGMTMMAQAVWTPGYAVLMFAMWWVMMVAMMLPSAAPMVLLFATINRKQPAFLMLRRVYSWLAILPHGPVSA